MNRFVLAVLFVALPALAQEPLSWRTHHTIQPADSPTDIVRKAAHVIPSSRQLAYLRREFVGFIHFGPNTFSGSEWGTGLEAPSLFAPERVDTDQWIRAFKAAGIQTAVLTVKHHDGYLLWPSRYEDQQTLRNSPYRGGHGDVLRQLATSCQAHGLGLGVYLSPADLFQIESEGGLYGNGSEAQSSVIPTEPEFFLSDPTRIRTDRPRGAPVFSFRVDDYNRYMLNQLYELLTEYGPVEEVWFDGAHPKRKGDQQYDQRAWFTLIRALQPEAVIFGGPDVRWGGNEAGHTRDNEWNVIPLSNHPEEGRWGDRRAADLGSRERLHSARYLYYQPAEINTSIRQGWFWRDDLTQAVRTPDGVFDIYERAAGGNAVFMLNVPPNRDGVFSEQDVRCLEEVGRRIRETYETDLTEGAAVPSPALQDGDPDSFWQPETSSSVIDITLPEIRSINRFVLRESIRLRGERIEQHSLEAWLDGSWTEVARAGNVGNKRILRFPTVETDRLRLQILQSRGIPAISELSAHRYRQPPPPVTGFSNLEGQVTLQPDFPSFSWKGGGFRLRGTEIRYSLDGSDPDHTSKKYTAPIDLRDGGHLRARSFSEGEKGPVAALYFGPAKVNWTATASSAHSREYGAGCAIDADPQSFWHSRWHAPPPGHPHTWTVNFHATHRVTAFTYLPRQDRPIPDSMIEKGRVEISLDGNTWLEAGTFTFGNLVNDPTERTLWFKEPMRARFMRVVSLAGAQDKPYAGAAEIGIRVK